MTLEEITLAPEVWICAACLIGIYCTAFWLRAIVKKILKTEKVLPKDLYVKRYNRL